mmetsp:Transcript_37087/g.109376  ORF Transcript_37087/g.109376 Transcript_37087/m.109376 type:complete len:271 (-) Transcript_37087:410-1222(-)
MAEQSRFERRSSNGASFAHLARGSCLMAIAPVRSSTGLVGLAQVCPGGCVNLDLLPLLDERRHGDHSTGFQCRAFAACAGCGIALYVGRAVDHLELNRLRRIHRDHVAIVEHELANGALLQELGPVILLQARLLKRLLVHEHILLALSVHILRLALADVSRVKGLARSECLLHNTARQEVLQLAPYKCRALSGFHVKEFDDPVRHAVNLDGGPVADVIGADDGAGGGDDDAAAGSQQRRRADGRRSQRRAPDAAARARPSRRRHAARVRN